MVDLEWEPFGERCECVRLRFHLNWPIKGPEPELQPLTAVVRGVRLDELIEVATEAHNSGPSPLAGFAPMRKKSPAPLSELETWPKDRLGQYVPDSDRSEAQ